MAYLQTIFICPCCKDRQPLSCIRPQYFTPARMNVTCVACETVFAVTVSKIKGQPKQHKFDAEVLKVGEQFRKTDAEMKEEMKKHLPETKLDFDRTNP